MSSVSLRRTLASLALAVLVCLPSVALAAPSGRSPEAPRAAVADQGVFNRIWSLLQRLWGEEGISIDPNGVPHAVTTPGRPSLNHLSGAAGMMIDPNGAPTSSNSGSNQGSGDTGMSIDPDGSH